MNRIITAIDQEISELDAKAAKLRMLRQAAVSIEEDGPVALEAVAAHELEPGGVATAEAAQVALEAERAARLGAVAAAPKPKPQKPKRRPRANSTKSRKGSRASKASTSNGDRPATADAHAEIDDRVYDAIAAVSGGTWMPVGAAVAHELGIPIHKLKSSKRRLLDAGRIEMRGQRAGAKYRPVGSDEPDREPEPPRKSLRPPRPETAEHAQRKATNIGKAKAVDERLVAMVEEAGVQGVDGVEVASGLDITPASAHSRLIRGVKTGRLVSFDVEGGGQEIPLQRPRPAARRFRRLQDRDRTPCGRGPQTRAGCAHRRRGRRQFQARSAAGRAGPARPGGEGHHRARARRGASTLARTRGGG